jgi:general secretion pathway protein J
MSLSTPRMQWSRVRAPGTFAGARGFTLIEVLLATALLAAALALGFATLSAATATVKRGELLAHDNERMRAVAGFLRTRIGSARAIGFDLDKQSGGTIRFIGDADRMRFVADLPDYLGRGGPYLHDLSVADAGPGRERLQIVFAQVQNATQVAETAPRPPEILADGLSSVQFRYRALDATGAMGDWQDKWTDPGRLPLQVSVRIVPATGKPWPELVVALPVSTGATTLQPTLQ